MDWGLWKVIHYTSDDLKTWRFEQFVRNSTCPPHASPSANCSVAYDSAVFRVRDGRHVLFSAGPSPGFTGPHPPLLCSTDEKLMEWTECADSLQLYKHLSSLNDTVGAEGAHVIDRNASVTYEGYSWLNWEGRGPTCDRAHRTCEPGAPNMARSGNGGLSWEASATNLWGDIYGTREFDAGMVAFQGPLLLQGSDVFALYFTEGSINNGKKFPNNLPGCAAGPGITDHRSMVQLARVHLDQTSGWLAANRSEAFSLTLQPPPNAAPPPLHPLPKVWAVAKVEAAAIALAEINRWVDLTAISRGKLTSGLVAGFKLAEASYKTQQQPTAVACVAACSSDANCSAITFCAKGSCGTGGGSGCGSTSGGCCYLMSHAADAAKGGACRTGAVSNCGAPASAGCRGWSASSKLGLRVTSSAGDFAGDEYQRWQNPQFSESYFGSIAKSGDGPSTVWHLSHTHNDTCVDRCGGKPILRFDLAVAHNGTITELLFDGAPLAPLQSATSVQRVVSTRPAVKSDDNDDLR